MNAANASTSKITRRAVLGGLAAAAAPLRGTRAQTDSNLRILATGLKFPEGPVALADGSLLVSEIAAGRITRVNPDGSVATVAEPGGGPNGLAFGPGGVLYVCNGGGSAWREQDGGLIPAGRATDYSGGRIETVDVASGRVTPLYVEVEGVSLSAPNGLVFDGRGGFWFTDSGSGGATCTEHGGLFYGAADGSAVRRVLYPLSQPNGIGLSPDGMTLYVAFTHWREVRAYRVVEPGRLETGDRILPGRSLADFPGGTWVDSLAVEEGGNVCAATFLGQPGIAVIAPSGEHLAHIPTPDMLTTSICFGGPDRTTAYVTLSNTGRMVAMAWPRAGLRLSYTA